MNIELDDYSQTEAFEETELQESRSDASEIK